ncbi:unnamed protein product (macronuclear) [Paramecium tetraurelia]|uniref:Uncharacterized protein n=1 Tax=Paramecium tetraurelia TaxID=5888 RepID=A0C470_PARTE|nr:uncharacterized protein GSPATT00035067001 [Paramecium tetraurelia]CAK65587.1 unnamed protein product [Paramecium tetraurelia]|eukprot:XP_001432984.1 hypothetical protein (macronuclear) [Paramecium tetraurelia strain d4-2]
MLKYKQQRLIEDESQPYKLMVQQHKMRSSEKKRPLSRQRTSSVNKPQADILVEIQNQNEILTKAINSLRNTIEQFKE